ncbi:relaxase/mobilization nuclease domain-containing protein [Bacteroides sp. AN502(2024)]|uniref:relaxase/mobilization nuclease domain-containing protein n=1 Tax=Bacteroides sp. AN502(2024) TaxID=3160599 RepID=UPI003516E6EF
MIAKIMKGSDFRGVVYYILNDEKGTKIIDADGLFLENNDTIAQGFIGQAQMNPRVTKAVGHIALSFSKEDSPRLNNTVMAQIAREYMEKMGIRDTQYIIGRHFDKEHPHVHIAFNRIDNNGKTISDRNDRFRNKRICKELTKKYGLHCANGKEQVKIHRLREPDKTRYMLYQILKTEVGRCGNWNVLVNNLKRQGVDVEFKYKGSTDEIQDIVFSMNGYRFNGSKVDRLFSYSKIDMALRLNNHEERQTQPHPQANREEISPISNSGGDLINGSLGLFAPNNVPEEQQPYDPYLRNKKKKKQRKINW